MSNRAIGTAGWLDPDIDRLAAVAGIVLAALLFPLRFLSDELFIQVIPIVIGSASALYLVADRYGRREAITHSWHLSTPASSGLRGLVLLGIGGLALVASAAGGRTLPFFGLAAVVGALIFVQILFVREASLHPGSVVVQVVAFALVVRFGALATTPGLVGVDGWTHVTTYAQAIRETGTLSAIGESKYFAAPLYHLLAVVAAEAFNTSIRVAVYATLGVVMPISVILVYLTTRHLLPVRWALFAMAAYAVGDHVIRWGIHLIPTSMGLVFFMAVVYGITKSFFVERDGPVFALTALLGAAVVLTHQISAFVTLVFLGAAVVAQQVVSLVTARTSLGSAPGTEGTTDVRPLFLVVGGLTITNWALTPYGSGTFMETMLGNLQGTLARADFLDLAGSAPAGIGALEGLVTSVPLWAQFVDSLGFFLLLTGFVVGALALVRSDRRSQLSLTYVVAAAAMLVVTLGLPLFGVNLFVPGRWFAFMYVVLAIVATIGVRDVVTRLSSRGVVAGLLVLALVFPGAMLVSAKATPGDPVFEEHYPRYATTGSELAAVETISDIHPDSAATLRTDHPYRTVFTRWQGQPAAGFALSESGLEPPDAAVYREYQATGAPFARYDGAWVQVSLGQEAVCGESPAVVYATADVRYCRAPTALSGP